MLTNHSLCKVAAIAFGMLVVPLAAAQGYPSRPIKVIVNFPPAGPTDLVARTVGAKMGEILGQSVLIDNQPSANGVLGTQLAIRSAPDGYTLLLSSPSHTSIAKALYGDKIPYDPIHDIAPISLLVNSTQIIVANPALNVKTIADLVKLARSKPGQLNFGSGGVGTPNQLGMELLKSMAKIDMVHIAYKGAAPLMQDLLANRVQLTLTSMATVVQYINSGKLVALAVGTATRSPVAPDVPTVAESGYPGYEVSTWFALFTQNKTPAPIITQLNTVIRRALADPQVIRALTSQGAEPAASTPEFVSRQIASDFERWSKVIVEAKIVAE